MKPAQLYRRACEQARAAKETTPTHPLAVGITLWRDDEEVARIVLDQGTSAQMRCVAHMATVGMGAHCVSVVFEGWQANTPINPDTGNHWQAGEISAYAAAHGVGEVVGEAVVVHVATASEEVHAGALPFTAEGRRVTWGAPVKMRAADGAVPQTIAAALVEAGHAPAVLERMGRHPIAARRSQAWRRAVADTMTACLLTATYDVTVKLLAGPDQHERAEVINAYTRQAGDAA